MPARYLDDYARELRKIGERAFRRRYGAPVLIVVGRAGTPTVLMTEERPEPSESNPAAELTGPPSRRSDRLDPIHADSIHAILEAVFPLTSGELAAVESGGVVTIDGQVVVGRASPDEVDVQIPDLSISKRHCLFAPVADGTHLFDCGSTNGTWVNGTALDARAPVRLCGGELIVLGRLELTFETAAGFAELVSGRRLA